MSEYNEFEGNGFQSGDNEFEYNGNNIFVKQRKYGWSMVSFVSGLISVICCCLGIAGIALGAVAIVAALLSRKSEGHFDRLAITGLILGIFGILFGGAILLSIFLQGEEFWEEYIEQFKNMYSDTYPDI